MNLWPHQAHALKAIPEAINAGKRRICITSPTGGGKSRIMRERIVERGGKATLYTHRKLLFEQIDEGLRAAGIYAAHRAAGYDYNPMSDVHLAMVQSEIRSSRDIHDSDEVHVDEAHCNVRGKTHEMIEGHGDVPILYYTATPLGIGHACDHLIVAGRNSELRECGSHVFAHQFAPNEPSSKLVGKVKIGEFNECGIAKSARGIYAQRIVGSVIDYYNVLNPEREPTILFGPGVPESLFFCERFNDAGISAAHIDGKNCFVDGELVATSPDVRADIIGRVESGDIKVLCNRFVMREGIDIPALKHCIFATVMGSLTAYLQAGGRVLRSHPSLDHVTIQDHGGNWWRHNSLNADREWNLDYNDNLVHELHKEAMRESPDDQPIVCPHCSGIRLGGGKCPHCGKDAINKQRTRMVIQADGKLKPMQVAELRQRRKLPKTLSLEKSWAARVKSIQKSIKPTVQKMTFNQLRVRVAEENGWRYPPSDLPKMPIDPLDWFRPISKVPEERLRG